jgi:hypothetical protein
MAMDETKESWRPKSRLVAWFIIVAALSPLAILFWITVQAFSDSLYGDFIHPWPLGRAPFCVGLGFLVISAPAILLLSGFYADRWIRRRYLKRMADKNGYEYVPFWAIDQGLSILKDSMIGFGGRRNDSFTNYLCGNRRGYYFRVIDYGFYQGRSGFNQTVISISPIKRGLINFAIVRRELLSRCDSVGMTPTEAQPDVIPRNFVFVAHRGFRGNIFVPPGFFKLLTQLEEFNAEYIGDRLIIYKNERLIFQDDLLTAVDTAIDIAEILGQQV